MVISTSTRRSLAQVAKKTLRTAQSYVPIAKPLKDSAYRSVRGFLQVPHESDFRVLKHVDGGPGETFVDVGANHGQSIESIRSMKSDARIVSYEANPGLARTLSARYARDENVTIRPVGLSDMEGTFTLHVPVYRGFVYDGLASLDLEAATSWISEDTVYRFRKEKLVIRDVVCDVETLDAQNLAPAFIKVDVQGLEYKVIKGGYRTLERYRPVLLVEDYLGDPRLPPLLEALGYAEYHLDDDQQPVPGPGQGGNSILVSASRPLRVQRVTESEST
jgi:FkbM family methyltransferase